LERFRYPSKGLIVTLEGFRYPSWDSVPLEGFRGFIVSWRDSDIHQGDYSFTGGIQICFQGVYNYIGEIQISIQGFYSYLGGI